MPVPLAYLNGDFLPTSQLSLPVYDTGFVQGAAIGEQIRTFGGRLFRLEEHLRRLDRSLEIIGLADQVSAAALGQVATDLVARNHALLADGDDLGLSMFVTPGAYPTLAPDGADGPTIGLHTYPIPFHHWVNKYGQGERLIVSRVRQVPDACWPAELKCRSRMHYYLADKEAGHREPGARALLLDLDEQVVEASTANVILYRAGEGLVSPPRERILPGVSVAVVAELAAAAAIPFVHRCILVEDVLSADEVLLTSTSPCVLPVATVNGQPIGDRRPGPIGQKLLTAWSELAGVDIRAQAERFATRA